MHRIVDLCVVPRMFVACALVGLLSACGSDGADATRDPESPADVGAAPGASRSDGGSASSDASAASADASVPDAGAPDAGGVPGALAPEIVAGSHVQVSEARLELGLTFAETREKLGPGTRTSIAATRSYAWSLSDGVEVTVWFANSNLDSDDAAPADVDDTDRILWIAVKGDFPAATDRGIGLGATRAAVEAPAAYGPSPATAAADDGSGVVAQYFTAGVLVTYDAADRVRALTVSRLYAREPDGTIDVAGAGLEFGASGRIAGLRTAPAFMTGTPEPALRALLGDPDASGDIMNGSQPLRVFSYGFIGLEVFFLGGRDTVAFVAVHAPYFGRTPRNNGVGSARAAVESELGLGAGEAATNPQLVCYPNRRAPRVGVSYGPGDRVTSMTLPLLACP